MEKLCLSSTQSPTISRPFIHHFSLTNRARKRVFFPPTNPKKFSVFSSINDPSFERNNELNEWDLMELKFGKMIGEDPKLTLAKIKGRKINPDASFLEIEKEFYRNKGKVADVKEVPFDVPEKLGSKKVANGLKLVKPVPKKGFKVGGAEDSPKLPDIKRPSELGRSRISAAKPSSVPNVILRKPSVFDEKDGEMDDSSGLRIKPNLSISMRTEPVKEKFGGMTLLKRPQSSVAEEGDKGELDEKELDGLNNGGLTIKTADNLEVKKENETQISEASSSEVTLLDKPNAISSNNSEGDVTNPSFSETVGLVEDHVEKSAEPDLESKEEQQGEGFLTGMQQLEQTEAKFSEKEVGLNRPVTVNTTASELSTEFVHLQRPKRLDLSKKDIANANREEIVHTYAEGPAGREEKSKSLEDNEEINWTRVEQRFKFGDRVDVELISCSTRGFVVSLGSLIGFLPYRNLAAKWKFLAFESWLRKNGLDPSNYRQNLGIIGTDEGPSTSGSHESSSASKVNEKTELKVTADMELEELLRIYDQEKIQYLSSHVGQHIRVNILLADRNSRKLIFSMRPKEKEEIVEKKRSLMAKLSVGDVVKCSIKKITYFGIFVEVEGVPALVHQTEVSWDFTLDPTSYLKVGQVVEAKVHQLDFASERIFLSLKEITPDPLNEALECIVGNCSFNEGLEASQVDSEWTEVDSLVKELQEIDGIQTVTKGRFFLSPGLAPTFQVYMASTFENQYKLLARSGNKVQEVIVQASLDKEEMKSATLKCTNRVEL